MLLRQTSFRALAEPRAMRTPDGSVISGALRVRFGEVEARSIALTRDGRKLYDHLLALADQQAALHPGADRAESLHPQVAEEPALDGTLGSPAIRPPHHS